MAGLVWLGDALEGHRWRAAFILDMGTGLRRGELLGLRWQDVDLDSENPRLRVIHTIQRHKGKGLAMVDANTDHEPVNLRVAREPAGHRVAQTLAGVGKDLLARRRASLGGRSALFPNTRSSRWVTMTEVAADTGRTD